MVPQPKVGGDQPIDKASPNTSGSPAVKGEIGTSDRNQKGRNPPKGSGNEQLMTQSRRVNTPTSSKSGRRPGHIKGHNRSSLQAEIRSLRAQVSELLNAQKRMSSPKRQGNLPSKRSVSKPALGGGGSRKNQTGPASPPVQSPEPSSSTQVKPEQSKAALPPRKQSLGNGKAEEPIKSRQDKTLSSTKSPVPKRKVVRKPISSLSKDKKKKVGSIPISKRKTISKDGSAPFPSKLTRSQSRRLRRKRSKLNKRKFTKKGEPNESMNDSGSGEDTLGLLRGRLANPASTSTKWKPKFGCGNKTSRSSLQRPLKRSEKKKKVPSYVRRAFMFVSKRTEALVCEVLFAYLPEWRRPDSKRALRATVQNFYEALRRCLENRGVKDTLRYVKDSRLCVTRYLSGSPIKTLNGIQLCKSKAPGFPVWLRDLHYLTDSTSGIRVLLTLLTALRGVTLPKQLNTDPITSPYKGKPLETVISKAHHKRVMDWILPEGSRKRCEFKKFHMSAKAGPAGPAAASAIKDLFTLPKPLIDDIIILGGSKIKSEISTLLKEDPTGPCLAKRDFLVIDSLTSLLQASNKGHLPSDDKSLERVLNQIPDLVAPYEESSDTVEYSAPEFRKLSVVQDKEGKSRVIAILDYWSQTVLKPLHDHLMRVLSKLEQDCTFNQGSFLSKLPAMDGTRMFHSLDLSSATDRMPIKLQELVLQGILSKERSESWRNILVQWPYAVPALGDSENNKSMSPGRGSKPPQGSHNLQHIKYAVGQPMGAYSSWPAMALTHHYLVKMAALQVNKLDFKGYAILGDDIVIADSDVATEYRTLLMNLGMDISEHKTHSSVNCYEFAKRWIYKGSEITPFSIAGLMETWNKYSYLCSFLENQKSHGWDLPTSQHPAFVRTIYRTMGCPGKGQRVVPLYMVFGELLKLKSRETQLYGLAHSVVSWFKIPLSLPLSQSEVQQFESSLRGVKEATHQADLEKLQVGAKEFNALYDATYVQLFGAITPEYRTLLMEDHIPVSKAVNDLIEQGITSMFSFDPSLPVNELLCLEGLGKFTIQCESFLGIRRSCAEALGIARMVKGLVGQVRKDFDTPPLSDLGPPNPRHSQKWKALGVQGTTGN